MRDDRRIVRPHGAHVVSNRIVCGIAFSHGAHSPAGEQAIARQMLGQRWGLILIDDAAPEKMSDVGAEGIDSLLFPIESKRKVTAVRKPEVLGEPAP